MSNTSNRKFYDPEGLRKLAQIVMQARGDLSYREFEKVTGISHGTIRRLELQDVKMPDYNTLVKLAHPVTPYSMEELQAIVMQKEDEVLIRQYRTAEDILPMVMELPDIEIARLGQMLFAKLGKLSVNS